MAKGPRRPCRSDCGAAQHRRGTVAADGRRLVAGPHRHAEQTGRAGLDRAGAFRPLSIRSRPCGAGARPNRCGASHDGSCSGRWSAYEAGDVARRVRCFALAIGSVGRAGRHRAEACVGRSIVRCVFALRRRAGRRRACRQPLRLAAGSAFVGRLRPGPCRTGGQGCHRGATPPAAFQPGHERLCLPACSPRPWSRRRWTNP